MKHILITLLLAFSYISIAIIVVLAIAGRISRRTQSRLKREAGPKVVDMFAAGEEIRRKNAVGLSRNFTAVPNSVPVINNSRISEAATRPPAQNVPVKNQPAKGDKHVDRIV